MRRGAAALLLLACEAGCSRADEHEVDGRALNSDTSAVALVDEAFGSSLSIVTDRSPAVLHGDFNGDGVDDLIAVARARPRSDPLALPRGVRVVRPWSGGDGAAVREDLSRGADVTLAIVHGSGTAAAPSPFLLHDPDSISILDTGAARDAFVVGRAEVASLNAEVGARAQGDVYVLPTEAGINTFVYWDGSTYRAYQPLEYP